jgi:hypothetical protein
MLGCNVRVHLWLSFVGLSIVLVSCETLFGFRDLEVEPDDAGGHGGETSDGGAGGDAGGLPQVGGFGGEYGGFGGLGGYGGAYGGFGGSGGACGTLLVGDECTDNLECGTCICEDSGDEAMPRTVCCVESCLDCYDCNPRTGTCDFQIDQATDPPNCMGSDYCDLGTCVAG